MPHTRQWLSHLVLLTTLVISLVTTTARADPQETLTIAAANSLRDALRSVLPTFEAHHPRINLRVVYGPSQVLREQIQQGAPVDVFMPSLLEEIELLEQRGLIVSGTKQIYAGTDLVLITSSHSPAPVRTLDDLQTKAVRRLAVGDPKTSSLGKATAQFLKWMGKQPQWQPRYIYGEHSKVVLDLVSNGEAEIGIAYRADAVSHPNIHIIDAIPSDSHSAIQYAAATVWTARNISGAQAFTDFLSTAAVQTELVRYGFARRSASLPARGDQGGH